MIGLSRSAAIACWKCGMARSTNSNIREPSSHESATTGHAHRVVVGAAWHGLLWLVIANAIGSMIAVLLLVPRLNILLGEWTYGRWMMVHMNLMLYGWTSLP